MKRPETEHDATPQLTGALAICSAWDFIHGHRIATAARAELTALQAELSALRTERAALRAALTKPAC